MTANRSLEAADFVTPDFEYPQTVIQNADELLRRADSMTGADAGKARLYAMLELAAATSQIDDDSLFTIPARIDEQARISASTQAYTLMLTLEAKILAGIYTAGSYTYDRVSAPLLPLPEDPARWSGDQFRHAITDLLQTTDSLPGNDPLTEYAQSIMTDTLFATYFPDVESFVAQQQYEIYRNCGMHHKAVGVVERMLMRHPAPEPQFFYWTTLKNDVKVLELLDLYKANKDHQAALILLNKAANAQSNLLDTYPGYHYGLETEEEDGNGQADKSKIEALLVETVALIDEGVRRYPSSPFVNELLNRRIRLTAPGARVSIPQFASHVQKIDACITSTYTQNLKLKVFALPAGVTTADGDSLNHYPLKQEIPLTLGCKPLENDTVQLSFDRPGTYGVVCVVNDTVVSDPANIIITSVMAFTVETDDLQAAVVTDYENGAPKRGAEVWMITNQYRRQPSSRNLLGRTDGSGTTVFERPTGNGYAYRHLQVVADGVRQDFAGQLRVTNRYNYNENAYLRAMLFTDRNLYHRGDSIGWFVTVANLRTDDNRVAVGEHLDVNFYDANGQKIDSVAVVTDSLGRADGNFVAPATGLSGSFRIEAMAADRTVGSTWVTVSDFKMPTFRAKIDTVRRDFPAAGDVTIEGVARTYSGMPVAGATVSVVCRMAPLWFLRIPTNDVNFSDTVSTGEDGRFKFTVPASVFPAKFKSDIYLAECNVVSTTGEAENCTRFFSIGKPYILTVSPQSYYDGCKPALITFKACDAENDKAKINVHWQLMRAGSGEPQCVLRGDALTGEPMDMDFNNLAAGRYFFRLTAADPSQADELKESSVFTVYNSSRNLVPDGEPLFLPKSQFDDCDNAEVLIGVPGKDTWVYIVRPTKDNLKVEAKKLGCGFHKFKVEIPEGVQQAQFIFANVTDGELTYNIVTLRRPQPSVKLTATTFRDNLVPGNTETWTFRLTDAHGNPVSGAALTAAMYNHALDAIGVGSEWSGFSQNISMRALNPDRVWSGTNTIVASDDNSSQVAGYFVIPDYRFYDEIEFPGYYMPMFRQMKRSQQVTLTSNNLYGARAAQMNAVPVDVELDMAAPMGAVVEEAATEDAAPTWTGAGGETPEPNTFEYRPSEVLQAFFRPSLTTDAEGNALISFEVPQANGQWTFNALAWTPSALWSALHLQATSAKKIMVQPNLPRFLRQGDKATLMTSVFNNTEEAVIATAVFEIFEPETGRVMASSTTQLPLAPGASGNASVECQAPTDMAAIGVRVRATAGEASDGEQTAIPVLEAAGTVIESTQFYINPGEQAFTLDYNPEADATVTLQYCQNPVWTVVRALRGLSGRDASTSTAIVSRLYSALAAARIIKDNPTIPGVIARWKADPSQQALASMLQRNQQLKKLMLDRTPWVQTAANSTRRMEMLAEAFDPQTNSAAVRDLTAKLYELQNADGGFAWAPWASESSLWCTESVLTTLGLARSMDMLDADDEELNRSVMQAYSWYCNKIVAMRPQVRTSRSLTLMAALWPGLETPAAAQRIIDRTVDEIAAARRTGIVEKAYDIIILHANGRDSVCRRLLESIRQHGVVRPGQGMCFPNVSDIRGYATIIQAFALMDAPAAELDAMRQWITVTAQTNENLGAYNPDYVIAAVMLTGTCWTDVPASENVTVDGTPLQIAGTEAASGYFSAPLAVEPGHTLSLRIATNGVTPSYGSVISIAKRTMATTPAVATRDLSIAKRLLVQRAGQWVETDSLLLGEDVTVQLTLTVGRDMQYLTVDDERAACLEPVEQLPGWIWDGNIGFYRENNDATTRLFIGSIPRGTYQLQYRMTASVGGRFAAGTATAQSQMAPELTAHSAGATVTVTAAEP